MKILALETSAKAVSAAVIGEWNALWPPAIRTPA